MTLMARRAVLAAAALLLFGLGSTAALAEETGYYRWPALHGEVLVFASEGDLWRAPSGGGRAQRLTTHPEEESRPAISPDGKWLAFNARYDGATEVYVMPLTGGAPVQLSFEGGGTAVRGWTPDGKVLFTSTHLPGTRQRVLRTVDKDSLQVETLPLLDANLASFSDDGQRLFFTRFGLSLSNDNAILYRGGRMAQLWRYDLDGDAEATRLAADFAAPIRHPMWWQGRIYFISDKSGSDNIWSLDEAGGDPRQHSRFEGWQLRNPRLAEGEIVYQRGADLYRSRLDSGEETRIELTLVSDRDHGRLRWIDKPTRYLETSRMGATGESVALTARGKVARAFTGQRRRVELDLPDLARARAAAVGAEGEWIYLVLDQDRVGEVWRYPADGRGTPEQLTEDSDAHIWGLHPSPDASQLLFDDKAGRLWLLNLETREKTQIDSNEGPNYRPFRGFAWSPGGRYLAYGKIDARGITRLVLRDLKEGRRETLTGGKYEAFDPAFAADGKWLYFISQRNFVATPSSPWGDRNMGPAFDRRGKLFALRLDPEARFPFSPPNELTEPPAEENDQEETGENAAEASETEAEEKVEDIEIVFDGLAERLWELPVEPGNYWALTANAEFLYVLDWNGKASELKSIAITPDKPEVKVFSGDVRRFALSADGKTLFFHKGKDDKVTLALVPATAQAPDDLSRHLLRVDDWRLGIDPRNEWRQMLLDAWRLHRDFSFDPKLRGVDWEAVLDKYLPFVERIGHRSELDDILGQMVAELGILHSQIRVGDLPRDAESGDAAFLGAEFTAVDAGLEITLIYDGERELPAKLGPLLKPGVELRPGDVLTAVDGRAVRSPADLAAGLSHKAGQQVRLDLRRGTEALSRIVTPVDEKALRRLLYRHWVQTRREKVAAAAEGQIGYLHLRAMGRNDIASFARDFYEHFDKDGLIIDVRGNRGGNIDSWLIGTLLRQVWAFWEPSHGGPAYGNMQQTFRGHLVVLISEGTYSDGETFSAGIKALGLAPLIGTRTAGAGIWLSDRNRLADRGMARIAEHPQYGLDGRWLVEGRGVSPDIEVVNPPRASSAGEDAQLEAALRYLQDKIEAEPIPDLKARPLPGLGTPGEDVR